MDAGLRMRIAFCLLALGLLSACSEERFASARIAATRNDLIGGPAALGDIGDYVIENDRLRAVILAPGHLASPAIRGGGLVDLDLRRPQEQFRHGRALDQFYLTLPMVNIMVPNPEQGCMRILRDGSDGGPAAIRVVGKSDVVMGVLNVLQSDMVEALGVQTDFFIAHDYLLEPGATYIEMITTVRLPEDEGEQLIDCSRTECEEGLICDEFYGGCYAPCQDGECVRGGCDPASNLCVPVPREMELLQADDSLMDVISGGLISGDYTYKPGLVAGDMLLFGAKVHAFCPGIGFDLDLKYRDIFLRGGNSIQSPLTFELMAAVGDRVSYAFLSPDGPVLFPFSSESLTGSLTHRHACLRSAEDDEDCDQRRFARYRRYLVVGEGDVASLMRTVYEIRDTNRGEIQGVVLAAKTSEPITKADVFVFRDPCKADCAGSRPEPCGPFETYAELAEAARRCSATEADPDGNVMMVSHFRSDVGSDPIPDGVFSGPLAAGDYYLVARDGDRMRSAPVPVRVIQGQRSEVVLAVPPAGKLAFRVLDQTGSPVPARVTVGHCFPECHRAGDCAGGAICDPQRWQCLPADGCSASSDCDPDEDCLDGRCRCSLAPLPGEPKTELGEGYLSDRLARVELSASGQGEIALPPGEYDVIVSRGFEYSIDTARVEILPDHTTRIEAQITHVIDSRGWIAGDSHMHGTGSPDANVRNEERVVAAMADGVEFLSTSDHDYIQSLEPQIREMGAWEYLATWPGLEVTTLDISHILGFPLHYDFQDGDRGAMDWVDRTPRETFEWIRAHGMFGPEETLVIIPHPRGGMSSYHDQYNLDPYDLSLQHGFNQDYVPLLAGENFVNDFDGMEIANSKRFDILRIPTASEVIGYSIVYQQILRETKGLPFRQIADRFMQTSERYVLDLLARTPEEHEAIWHFDGSTQCRMPASCSDGADCDEGQTCHPLFSICVLPCTADADCTSGEICGPDAFCAIPPNNPCEGVKGLTDDWLRMIDYGIYKTAVGGSDAHATSYYEVGVPRTYLRSTSDDPPGIDLHELVRDYKAGRAFVSYGPFVDFTIDGKGPGEIVDATASGRVTLRLRVQSPDWFDVSRVEIYRNGRLDRVIDEEIPVPNTSVVVLDAEIELGLSEDSWFVVFVMGLRGRSLRPVYGSPDLPPIYFADIFAGAFGGVPVPLPETMNVPKLPVYYPTIPVAITNPILVDVDGEKDGCRITPVSGPLPDWACRVPPGYPAPCGCGR
ncbi:MAG: hypothetical protein JXR96_17810 [Deltaproteobacteria bacterium]|nr:hypothetical protein [Deltaproteobacteria bacterium]